MISLKLNQDAFGRTIPLPRTIQPRHPKMNLTRVSKVQAFMKRMTQALSG